jgi:hypothetical protein
LVVLAGFGLDSLIEIGASMVMIWELAARMNAVSGAAPDLGHDSGLSGGIRC